MDRIYWITSTCFDLFWSSRLWGFDNWRASFPIRDLLCAGAAMGVICDGQRNGLSAPNNYNDQYWLISDKKYRRCGPKSPASRLFTQAFIQAQIKEIIKAGRHWPLWGEFTGDRASNAENVSIWWRRHDTWDKVAYTVHIGHIFTWFSCMPKSQDELYKCDFILWTIKKFLFYSWSKSYKMAKHT